MVLDVRKEPSATTGPVLIIGSGLLGASIGLALTALEVPVRVRDASPVAQALARDIGAGELDETGAPEPALVVVATPPDVTAGVIGSSLHMYPHAVVTDVASVKGAILEELSGLAHLDLSRYVGGHPMAGRERTGAAAATGELFAGRPWVVCPHQDTDPEAELMVRHLATDLGASPIVMTADEHDHAVSLVSHVPQLVSSLLAARLVEAPEDALGLAGQGLRDLTRIAASDPTMWRDVFLTNREAVLEMLGRFTEDLSALQRAIRYGDGDALFDHFTRTRDPLAANASRNDVASSSTSAAPATLTSCVAWCLPASADSPSSWPSSSRSSSRAACCPASPTGSACSCATRTATDNRAAGDKRRRMTHAAPGDQHGTNRHDDVYSALMEGFGTEERHDLEQLMHDNEERLRDTGDGYAP